MGTDEDHDSVLSATQKYLHYALHKELEDGAPPLTKLGMLTGQLYTRSNESPRKHNGADCAMFMLASMALPRSGARLEPQPYLHPRDAVCQTVTGTPRPAHLKVRSGGGKYSMASTELDAEVSGLCSLSLIICVLCRNDTVSNLFPLSFLRTFLCTVLQSAVRDRFRSDVSVSSPPTCFLGDVHPLLCRVGSVHAQSPSLSFPCAPALRHDDTVRADPFSNNNAEILRTRMPYERPDPGTSPHLLLHRHLLASAWIGMCQAKDVLPRTSQLARFWLANQGRRTWL